MAIADIGIRLPLRFLLALLQQGDRWEEGHDPELFNLRRKTSKEDVVGSLPLQSQYAPAGGSRSLPSSQGAAPQQKDLPPHLLRSKPSEKVGRLHSQPFPTVTLS